MPAATATAAAAPACAPSWSASTVYWGGDTASLNGTNWRAKWWTQNERPAAGVAVWESQGACGGSGPGDPGNPGNPSGFVVSEAQFNQMFPNRNPFYTYQGLTSALSAYPGFAKTGDDTTKRREAAAFLANISHETGGLVHIVEQDTSNYPHYCDSSQPYGCPAGQAAYYGRGPIQLSWNFNYKAAGDALGIDLLNNPWLVQNDPAVAMKTALWYWNTQSGPGTMTAHHAMVNGHGFGQTIRSINGALECDGKQPAKVQSRITKYQQFTQILGTTPGGNLSC
ncbi:glycoside hydrolase family 19 protein [Streptomyces sp. 549]|uniref:glycoside hydrolase family 19 protein n=1 Tax=Streptomyces sp. 549 TaxID=3049076 RepID=UPI0024C21649|nr:glycoside hydrolase family 19 protein [Streptomyces sp. 549]MDK1473861.1 glycoside hydrolase family 19 protein [Streptomyces sp. 549]